MMADVCCGHGGALVTALPKYFDTLVVGRVTDGALGHLVPGSLWSQAHFGFYFILVPFWASFSTLKQKDWTRCPLSFLQT